MIAVGLMSGTSLDGIDAALVDIRPEGSSYRVEMLNFLTAAFDDDLLARLHGVLPPASGSVAQAAWIHHALGVAFAGAAADVAAATPIDYVASHGQTIWHDGDAHVTLQVGDAFVIRERMRATVCYDFRSGDCAAGGHGAPLVPYVDALLLGDEHENRVAINIGGIANLTVIRAGASAAQVNAFDSGPGNMLIDAFVRERTRGKATFDREGALAANGTPDRRALDAMRADPYFARPAPKTTGRERFGAQFLRKHSSLLDPLTLEDGAATLTELTAGTIADGVRAGAPAGSRVMLSGGGARNGAIVRALRTRLPGYIVETTQAMNVAPDAKEALAFAVLGYETLRERAANVPRVTGAAHETCLGAIAPYDLRLLLEKVREECRL